MPTEKQILVSVFNEYNWDSFTIKELFAIHKTIYNTRTIQKKVTKMFNKIGDNK